MVRAGDHDPSPSVTHRQRMNHPHPDWDALVKVATYRNSIHAAHARVTQALLILEFPEHDFPATVYELLRDAELALRRAMYEHEDMLKVNYSGRGNDVY